MFIVIVTKRTDSERIIVGKIHFQGIPLVQSDGSMRIPVGPSLQEIPKGYHCTPRDLIPEENIQRIGQELSTGAVMGQVGQYEWKVE